MYWLMKYEATAENINRFIKEFKCRRCRDSCCLRLDPKDGIFLKVGESKRLAYFIGMNHNQFKERYTWTRDGKMFMVAPCPFFSKEKNGCLIHPYRPLVCWEFPFNRSIEVEGKQMLTVNVDCPAGKEMGEKYAIKPETVGVR